MPGIAQKISNSNSDIYDSDSKYQNPSVGNGIMLFNGSSGSKNGSWSKNHDDLSYIQLQKFWCELTPQDRHKLMRIDKQTLFEHARKNMYCSRCNGLLLEGFLQIVMHGKSLQQDAAGGHYSVRNINTQTDDNSCIENGCQHDAQDPSVHPWGGLTTARDGTLTLLDGYLCSKSLKGLQNVFDSARARERERELLYPDACGGGGRGWISQGMAGYGRAHGNRETCALHTARLSVETLVDFWSALGEETRQSLLRMKEEDFIERLMYRFDSKRFCRDCRRNVIREFKELKELKRMRKDPRCTNWFCVADTAFQYEVSHDTVQADWHQTFPDSSGAYHHFEWAIGTGEGKSDILEYENVGLSVRVQVNGLDLSGLNACYITLRAWKKDGRCSELCVKAHPLRGQQCVHYRLVVGDGFVSITRGESISRFFEHAEEAEEEEDDDSMDREGNELDGGCSRPQKHAKSPELAREFLLDAATVIFKEQVEKAFREGTARQNAHSIFVCLALKLLEERIHVACKEIITLEKQTKLLEEEEKEKREEEERKERKRTKEREKKLRRKERLREKENKEKKCVESNPDIIVPDASVEESIPCVDESANVDSISETGEASPLSSDIQDDQLLTDYNYSNMDNPSEYSHEEFGNMRNWNASFPYDHCKYTRRITKLHKDPQQDCNLKWPDRRKEAALSEDGAIFSKYEARYHTDGFESTRSINGFSKQLRSNTAKSSVRNGNRSGENFQCPKNRISHGYGSHGCSCNNHSEYRSRPDSRIKRVARESKCENKLESPSDVSKPYYHGNMYTQVENAQEINGRPKSKIIANTKKVWEPLDPHKRYVRSNSDSDFILRSTTKVGASESVQITKPSVKDISVPVPTNNEDNNNSTKSQVENCKDSVNDISQKYSQDVVSGVGELTLDSSKSSSSNSDNCSLCPSESSSNALNQESSSTSNSEESSQNSEGRETSPCLENGFTEQEGQSKTTGEDVKIQGLEYASTISSSISPKEASLHNNENGRPNICIGTQTQNVPPQMHNQNIHYPVVQAPTMGYYHQTPIPWAAGPPNAYPYFPNTYGYGFNGNARFMQYGTLQHMGPPLLNSACNIPVFQPVAQVNGVKQKEQTRGLVLGGLNEVQHNSQNVHAPTDVENDGKPDKMDTRNNGFSLFHFGGPVGLSTGFKVDTFPLKEGIVAGDDHHPNNKKDFIEEYNLFAASNGIKFSFL